MTISPTYGSLPVLRVIFVNIPLCTDWEKRLRLLSDPSENWHGGWGYVSMCQVSDNEEVKVLQVFSRVEGIVSKNKKKMLEADGAKNFPTFAM